MVKMSNGKWRMCTDDTDLNKACLKDSYPLPSIDRLVDEEADHNILCFLDAYSGYNQIQMQQRDKEKIVLMTDCDIFYYEVMSFGLNKCRCHLSKVDGLHIQKDAQPECQGLC